MKIKAINFLFLLFFILTNNQLLGQENYYTKTFTTDNGLPHNHVRSIAQDSTGFLWIATWDGLSRYDGYEFRNYFHNPADSTSIGYFICENILVDYKNNVWIEGVSAVSKYNRSNDNFTQFRYHLIGGSALDRESKYWVATDEGFHRWDYEKNTMQTVKIVCKDDNNLSATIHPWLIFFDNDNYFITGRLDISGIIKLYRGKVETDNECEINYLGYIDVHKYGPEIVNYSVELNFINSGDEFYLLGNLGVFKQNKVTKEFLPSTLSDSDTRQSELLFKASQNQKLFKVLSKTSGNQFVETAFADRQNTVWQGILSPNSNQIGLTGTIKVHSSFRHYFTELNQQNELIPYFPVIKDRYGIVWGGAANTNYLHQHHPDGRETKITPVDKKTWNLAQQRPRSFLEDEDGIWIGYFERLLLKYDFKTSNFRKIYLKETGYEDNSSAHSFVHLKKTGNELLIVGFKQIFKFNPETGKFNLLKVFDLDELVNLYSVAQDEDKTWWIGGNQSRLYHFDIDFNQIEVFDLTRDWFNIEDILIGDNNDLWLSLLGGGLAHFNIITGKTIKVYTTADGLSNNTCYGMLKDKKGNLWISTNKGISKFNPKTELFETYGKTEGLEIEEFNSDNAFLAPDGEMFFAGMGGVVSFYPDSLEETTQTINSSPIVFTDFKVSGNNRYFSKAVYECDTLILYKGENNFQLTFACLDFKNAEKTKYRYRLLPANEKFVQTDFRHRTLNYANLTPGKYQLEVEATNENGEWAVKKELVIFIPTKFYQTWWFRILIVVIISVMIAYLIYSYNHQIRIKALKKQDELKLESLRGQMNPHFIFNSLNSINYFIAQNDRLSANRYIADFSRLVRSFLGNLSHEFIPLSKELEALNDYLKLEHLRFGDKFDYELVIDPKIQEDEFFVFPGMVQPFVENAIWHGVRGLEGRKGFVRIRFSVGEDCIKATIEDDGVGRRLSEINKSQLTGKTSRGIGIVLERLKIINNLRKTSYQVNIGDLYSEREESGTLVNVDIPVNSKKLNLKRNKYFP